jgi:hypothetical protein
MVEGFSELLKPSHGSYMMFLKLLQALVDVFHAPSKKSKAEPYRLPPPSPYYLSSLTVYATKRRSW